MMFSLIVAFLSVQATRAFSVRLICPYTHPNEVAGICYKNCPSGYEGVAALCLKNCAGGWKVVGPSCNRWNSKVSCSWCKKGWFRYPCCKGGWEVQTRHTKTRQAKEMMVTFSIDPQLEAMLMNVVEATKKITEGGIVGLAKEMQKNLEGNLDLIKSGGGYADEIRRGIDTVGGELDRAYNTLKHHSISWVEDAVGAAFALHNGIKKIGRRRLELHEAGEHPSQTGEPAILIDTEEEFVEELADGTIEVVITRELLDANVMKMLLDKVGGQLRAKGESEEDIVSAMEELAVDLKKTLFEEEEGKSGDMTIEEYIEAGGDGLRAEALSRRLEEDEELSSDHQRRLDAQMRGGTFPGEELSSDHQRRLGAQMRGGTYSPRTAPRSATTRRPTGTFAPSHPPTPSPTDPNSTIGSCEYGAITVSAGVEVSIAGATGFAGVVRGWSLCGNGSFGTVGGGAYVAEGAGIPLFGAAAGAGIEVFAAFDHYLAGKDIAGRAQIVQIGFDVPSINAGNFGVEQGVELQLILASPEEKKYRVTGFGVTGSGGFGVLPASVTPLGQTYTAQFAD